MPFIHDYLVPRERRHERNDPHGDCYKCFIRLSGCYMYLVMMTIVFGGFFSLYIIFTPDGGDIRKLDDACKLVSGDPSAHCALAVRQCYPHSTVTLPSSHGQVCGNARVCCAPNPPKECPIIAGAMNSWTPTGNTGGSNSKIVENATTWVEHVWVSPASQLASADERDSHDDGVWGCCAKVLGKFVPRPMIWIWFTSLTSSFVSIALNLISTLRKKSKNGDDDAKRDDASELHSNLGDHLLSDDEDGDDVVVNEAVLTAKAADQPFALRCFQVSTLLGTKTLITSIVAIVRLSISLSNSHDMEGLPSSDDKFAYYATMAFNGPLASGFTDVSVAWVGFAAYHVWRIFDRDVISGGRTNCCFLTSAFQVTIVACCIFAAMFVAPFIILGPYLPCCFHWLYFMYVDVIDWMVPKKYSRVCRYILTFKHPKVCALYSFLVLLVLYPGWLFYWLPGAMLFFPWWCAATCCAIAFFFLFGTPISYVAAKCRLRRVLVQRGHDVGVDALPRSSPCANSTFEVLRVWVAVVLAALCVNYCLSGCVNVMALVYAKEGHYFHSWDGYRAVMFQAFAMRSTACHWIEMWRGLWSSVDSALMFL